MRLFHFDLEDCLSFQIEEKGFVLDQNQRDKLNVRLNKILEKAPARAFARFSLEKEKKMFKGSLTIDSIPRTFLAETRGNSPFGVFNKLESQVERQLEQWRSTRFLDQSFLTGKPPKPQVLPHKKGCCYE